MKATRILSLVLAMMLFASAFAAELNEPGVLPLTNEDVTLTIGMPFAVNVTDYETNVLTQLVEETTGVKLDFVQMGNNNADAVQRFELMISAEDQKLPDILMLELSPIDRGLYANYFVDLTEYLDEAYFWNEAMDKWATPQEKLDVLGIARSPQDGKIYAWPTYTVSAAGTSPMGAYINKTWLDNLGLDIPETTDDLYTVLKAFKEEDANGNGDPNDEIPMVGTKSAYGWAAQLLMNSFVYDAYQQWWVMNVDEKGEVYMPGTTEEYREGLRYIRGLIEEGLLSDLTFSQTADDLRAIMSRPNDEASVIGVFVATPNQAFPTDDSADRVNEYVALAPLAGPEGIAYSPFSGYFAAYKTFITKDCADPDLAARVLDCLAITDISMTIGYGEKDVDWRYVSEGDIALPIEGYGPVFELLTVDGETRVNGQQNINWGTSNCQVCPAMLNGGKIVTTEGTPNFLAKQTLNNTGSALRYGQHPVETIPYLVYDADESLVVNDLQFAIYNYVEEAFYAFLLGERDIENDWDAYLADLAGLKLEEKLAIDTACYSRMKGE